MSRSMMVTGIEEEGKNKKKIYIDNEYVFFLYPKEVKQYGIVVGGELSEHDFLEIKQEVILKRAKRKMLALLSKKDYTCGEIERKLRQGYYTEDIIREVISYGMQKNYLNDEEYVRAYLACKKSKKSLRQMEQDFIHKGVAKAIYQSFLEREEEDEGLLRDLLYKYLRKQSGDSFKKIQKSYRYFVQKGYSGSVVRRILSEIEEEEKE